MAVEYNGRKITMKVVVPPSKPTEEKTVDLAMADGNQVVNPSEGKSLSKVTINKPATMLPANIAKGVDIGGVVGTFEGGKEEQEKSVTITENGTSEVTPDEGKTLSKVTVTTNVAGGEQPQLKAPTIDIAGKFLLLTNPTENGTFATTFLISYKQPSMLLWGTLAEVPISTEKVDLSTYITEYNTFEIVVRCKGENFQNSPQSNEVTWDNTQIRDLIVANAAQLSVARSNLAGASVGNSRVVFAGGKNANEEVVANSEAYNSLSTRSIPYGLSVARSNLAGASVGNYALFAGGYGGSSAGDVATVDAYDKNLTLSAPTVLLTARQELAGASVGNYALFAGGSSNGTLVKNVDVYNTSLTHSIATQLSASGKGITGASVGNYAVFLNAGISGNAYDTSLTRTTFSQAGKAYTAGASVGNYALFAGGSNAGETTYYDGVYSFSENLTKYLPTALSAGRNRLSGASIGAYAVFVGGKNADGAVTAIDAYDKNLTRVIKQSWSVGKYDLAGGSIDNYVFFAGGHTDSGKSVSVVAYYEQK